MISRENLALKDKGEGLVNLLADRLTVNGVEFFSFDEYFKANPLIEIVKSKVIVKQ